ncbi:MAG: WYL domain-containing protein [Bacillota bacterium]|nr:WYL domain-containing protein [Bacillota bacterium]
MPANSNLKLKPLYIMKILLEKTDENHPLTVNEIISELSYYDIPAERKSIYSDIDLLMSFGLDIICEKGRANKYFIGTRDFELPELKLLVDAVQSSKFITHKKSEELIKKIEKLTSIYEAKELHRHVVVADRVKTMNESIYYNVDEIHKAIQQNKQIRFKYFDYNLDKQIEYRRNGEWYYASPYALTWSDDNYYMIAYYERYNGFSNFRVDRMAAIQMVKKERIMYKDTEDFNVADYSKKFFRMFSGETETVKLQFHNSLINVVIDRFGKDIVINRQDDDHFIITVDVVATNTFLGWLFMFGDKVKILSPESLVEEFKNVAERIIQIYS